MEELLIKLSSDLRKFNPESPIVVYYNKDSHELTYLQHNRSISLSYLSHLILPKKMTYGILTCAGLQELLTNIDDLMRSSIAASRKVSVTVKPFGFSIYAPLNERIYPGPSLVRHLQLVSITNFWITKFILRHHDEASKIMLRFITKKHTT